MAGRCAHTESALQMSNGRNRLSRRAVLLEERASQEALSTSSSASDMSAVSAGGEAGSNGWTSSPSPAEGGVTGQSELNAQSENGQSSAAAHLPKPGDVLRCSACALSMSWQRYPSSGLCMPADAQCREEREGCHLFRGVLHDLMAGKHVL